MGIVNSITFLVTNVRLYKKPFLSGAIFLICLSFLSLPAPYLLKVVVDSVLPAKDVKLLNLIIIALLGVQVARIGFSYSSNYYFEVFNQEALTRIKKCNDPRKSRHIFSI